jgi:hypothetical protein
LRHGPGRAIWRQPRPARWRSTRRPRIAGRIALYVYPVPATARCLIRDRDGKYPALFDAILAGIDI